MDDTADHLRLVNVPEADSFDPLIGRVLDGRYRIERALGEGGMGLVYKATHVTLEKPLAIKVLRPEVSKDQEIVQRFRQEARSATAIGNEHIIDISDFGELDSGATYFVMEFLDGVSLTDAIQPGSPLDPGRIVHIGRQLCRALGAAHAEGIVHRDLKPDNVFLVPRGGDRDFVKVLDFGIAKVGGGTTKLTQAGQVFGTPHYMSPEQCKGEGVDHRTDVYALGVILYEMASSRVPFDADNLMGILTKHLYEEPVALHELPPPTDVSPGLEAIIMKCLAKSADHRYQSMQGLHDDLQRVGAGATPRAVTDRIQRVSSNAPRPSVERPSALTVSVGDVPGTRSRAPFVLGLLAVLGLGGAGAFFFLQGGEPALRAPGKLPRPEPSLVDEGAVAEPEPAPSEAEPAPDSEPAAPAPQVRVTSEPEAVEVYRDGHLIGATPYVVPKPTSSEDSFDVALRAEGYEEQTVRISRFTQQDLRVRLRKLPKPKVTKPKRTPKPAPARPPAAPPAAVTPPPEPAPAPAKPAPTPRRRSRSEVLDPWS